MENVVSFVAEHRGIWVSVSLLLTFGWVLALTVSPENLGRTMSLGVLANGFWFLLCMPFFPATVLAWGAFATGMFTQLFSLFVCVREGEIRRGRERAWLKRNDEPELERDHSGMWRSSSSLFLQRPVVMPREAAPRSNIRYLNQA